MLFSPHLLAPSPRPPPASAPPPLPAPPTTSALFSEFPSVVLLSLGSSVLFLKWLHSYQGSCLFILKMPSSTLCPKEGIPRPPSNCHTIQRSITAARILFPPLLFVCFLAFFPHCAAKTARRLGRHKCSVFRERVKPSFSLSSSCVVLPSEIHLASET